MHFITGGSFAGKRNWALNFYQLTKKSDCLQLFNFYSEDTKLADADQWKKPIMMLEGLEYLIKQKLDAMEMEEVLRHFRQLFQEFIHWEKQGEHRQVIIIGSDITKGIVPMEKRDREWRDAAGWVYQEAVRNAVRADIIWYGINETLKQGKEGM